MKKIFFYLIGILLTVGCTDPIVSTFGSIGGTVQDAKTGSFIQGVTVMLNPTGYSQVTNADGVFQYDNLDVAEYTLTFTKEGYENQKHKVTVKPGMVASVQITLTPASLSVSVEPSILDFGSDKTELQLKLSCTSGSVPYSLKAQNDWISLSKNSGYLSGTDYITVLVSRSKLSPSTYEGSILMTADTKETSIPVKMIVTEPGTPRVTIEEITDITTTKAVVSGNIVEVGDSGISNHGFCWSATNSTPNLSDTFSDYGNISSVKSFKGTLTGLNPATQYHVRAYATNASGTFYSDEVLTFTTIPMNDDDNNGGNNDSGSGSAETAVPQGLMSYYTFDNGDGADATENELDGNFINSPNFISETITGSGKALQLNGMKDQYMTIPYNVFKNLQKFSVSLWIKDFSIGPIFSAIHTGYSYPSWDFPRLVATANDTFQLFNRHDYSDGKYTPEFTYYYTSIQNSQWHHVTITVNNGIRTLYIDGVRVDSHEDEKNFKASECSKIYIGGNNDEKLATDKTSMKIDNIRFYQRCITDEEVKSIYESEK